MSKIVGQVRERANTRIAWLEDDLYRRLGLVRVAVMHLTGAAAMLVSARTFIYAHDKPPPEFCSLATRLHARSTAASGARPLRRIEAILPPENWMFPLSPLGGFVPTKQQAQSLSFVQELIRDGSLRRNFGVSLFNVAGALSNLAKDANREYVLVTTAN